MSIALKASGTAKPRWEGPVVAYTIHPQLTQTVVNRIEKAIAQWESLTNIRFVHRMSEHDYAEFQNGQFACFSKVGRKGGMQTIDLVAGCSVAAIVHEIGHAVGLVHEHQRPDRDSFVTPQLQNVIPGREGNFTKVKASETVRSNVYDLQSIMHYGTHTFSSNGQPTLVPVTPGATLDGSSTLTATDIAFVNSLYPNVGIVRRTDSSDEGAGEVKSIAVARDDTDTQVVTAVISKTGSLLLINWQVDALGAVIRQADSGTLAGQVSEISIAKGNNNNYVTAVRSGSGTLLLINWNVASNAIQRVADSGDLAGEADLIRIVRLKSNLFLTACRSATGTLLLITWTVATDGTFERLAIAEAGAVSEISLVRISSNAQETLVATTVRALNGSALSIVWAVSASGSTITRRGDSGDQMGLATQISSAVSPTGHLVVSCRASNGNLVVITLNLSPQGNTVTRVGDSGSQAGKVSEVSSIARPYGVLTGVRASTGRLLLIAWKISTGGAVTRGGDSAPDQAGAADRITLGPATGQTDAPVLTSVRTGSGTLKLITWDDESARGEL
jgi:hypothetical protein